MATLCGQAPPVLADTKLVGRHLRALYAGRNFLKRDFARKARRPVVGFLVDAEGREAAIVGRTELILWNVLCGREQLIAYLLGRLHSRVAGVDDADVGHLLHTVGV